MTSNWPEIPYGTWRETCCALHLYTQIVGKYRLAHTPWVNHSWHATFYVVARGLTTSIVPNGPEGIEVSFDLLRHVLNGAATDGRQASFPLGPMSVAHFHKQFVDLLHALGAPADDFGKPNEVQDPVPFAEDHAPRPYEAEAVTRFFGALVSVDRVLKRFRTGFLGKASPVHLYWGSFDLAVSRFSGRKAPRHPGGIPNLPDAVTREAYSHEVSSAGFWPGGNGIDFPAFYSYAYPKPEGFEAARPSPTTAYFDSKLGEFILPYDAVRQSGDPETTLMDFLESTYRIAADLGGWDRSALECPMGVPMRPRCV